LRQFIPKRSLPCRVYTIDRYASRMSQIYLCDAFGEVVQDLSAVHFNEILLVGVSRNQ
jgi:hypothetical protein